MKRWIKIGALLGFLTGVIVFVGYIITSWWVCTTLLDCPGHWLPYLIIFGVGTTVSTLFGITVAAGLRGLYQFTRVDG